MIHHHMYDNYGPAEVRLGSDGKDVVVTWAIDTHPAVSLTLDPLEAEELGGDLLEAVNKDDLERSDLFRAYADSLEQQDPEDDEVHEVALLRQAMNLLGFPQ